MYKTDKKETKKHIISTTTAIKKKQTNITFEMYRRESREGQFTVNYTFLFLFQKQYATVKSNIMSNTVFHHV